ncbi:MAG: carboxypeptidase-like regulatory domain-containing protein [Gemmataceae bacterium]|nr:carboxypeptidase-like regulatory domain-containing protein [Gemmataceae bacterium]
MQVCRAFLLLIALMLLPGFASAQDGKLGTIVGQVRWEGAAPEIADFEVVANRKDAGDVLSPLAGTTQLNPHRPRIGKSGGVADAIVWLEGIDAKRIDWKGEETRVEFEPKGLFVLQGQNIRPTGIVKRGDKIEVSNRDERYHALKVRGANFFQLPLPKRNVPSRRAFTETGITELGCGGGFYWLRAYLYVSDSPFATTTDDAGFFRLNSVPPGNYRVVAWLPNWHVAGRDLDFESKQTLRLHFAPPVEKRTAVEAKAGSETRVEAVFSAKEFTEK